MALSNERSLINTGIRKVIVTLLTQAFILVLSLITGFILPKKMGPEMFGYWQIYVFYLAYLNLFGLGLNDGLSLFYSGRDYKELPFTKIRGGLRVQSLYIVLLSSLSLLFVTLWVNPDVKFIWIFIVLNISLTIIQCNVLTLFLAVNKTAVYNLINFALRVLCTTFYVCLIFFNYTNYKYIIVADFSARLIITIICIIIGKQFFFGKIDSLLSGVREALEKSRAGINVTISAIAITYIPVAGRAILERRGTAFEYGIYSFAVSLIHLIIIFTNAAGMVIFPLLKKISSDKLQNNFKKLLFSSNTIVFFALFAYVPTVLIIRNFMPEYFEVLKYLHIILVMCAPLGKIQLIIVPYYKAARLENKYLYINIITLIIITLLTYLVHIIFNTIFSIVVLTSILIYLWALILEKNLLNQFKIKSSTSIRANELIIMLMFILAASFNSLIVFISIYALALLAYCVVNRKIILDIFALIKYNRPNVKE